MTPNPRFRQAREFDAPDLVCLIHSASRGLALWSWSTLREPGQTTLEVARHRLRTHTASPLYYGGFIVAEVDGAIAGALTGRMIPIRPRAQAVPALWLRGMDPSPLHTVSRFHG